MTTWAIPALAFAAAIAVVLGLGYGLTSSQRRIGRRVDRLSREPEASKRAKHERDRFPVLTALLEREGHHSAIEERLDRAGLDWRPSEFAALSVGAMGALAVAGWLVFGPLGAAVGIVIAALAPFGVLKALEVRRLREFERQLPDALMLMASSLRSGYGTLRAMQAVHDEMAPPISIEFGRTLEETRVGVPTAEALAHLARRAPLPDLDIAITAILIQLETGGNLAEVMEIVAATVRERQRIRAEVNTLTAEGRMSGIILFILPLAMAAVLGVLNPGYMSALFATAYGHLLIVIAAALQLVGGLVIYRMLQIDF
ncbi:MAG TPA: type II secretion system F family protein [Armatimonadota bacterium]|nr:type II secretion system F family protein [Armatimonadota bacterium]